MRAKIAFVLVCLLVGGFFVRYGSARPCDWLVHDWSAKTGLPLIAVEGLMRVRLRAPQPTAGSCLKAWVQLHFKGIEGVG